MDVKERTQRANGGLTIERPVIRRMVARGSASMSKREVFGDNKASGTRETALNREEDHISHGTIDSRLIIQPAHWCHPCRRKHWSSGLRCMSNRHIGAYSWVEVSARLRIYAISRIQGALHPHQYPPKRIEATEYRDRR